MVAVSAVVSPAATATATATVSVPVTVTVPRPPPVHRQGELRDEAVGERGVVQPGQPHRPLAPAHLDACAKRQVEHPPPIAPQHCAALCTHAPAVFELDG